MIELLAALTVLTNIAAADDRPCTPLATSHLRVRLTISQGVAAGAASIVRQAVEDAWRPEGLTFEWITERGSDPWQGVDVWLAAVHGMPSTEEAAVMGVAQFEGDVPLRLIRVSIDAVILWLRHHRTQVPGMQTSQPPEFVDRKLLARTLGYAAAHEIGHFVLASRQHAHSGLMQAARSGPSTLYTTSAWQLDAANRVRLKKRLHGGGCRDGS